MRREKGSEKVQSAKQPTRTDRTDPPKERASAFMLSANLFILFHYLCIYCTVKNFPSVHFGFFLLFCILSPRTDESERESRHAAREPATATAAASAENQQRDGSEVCRREAERKTSAKRTKNQIAMKMKYLAFIQSPHFCNYEYCFRRLNGAKGLNF